MSHMSRLSRRLIAAQFMDAATFTAFFLLLPSHVGYAEQNPLVLGMMAIGGVWLVIAVKVGLAFIVGRLHDREAQKPHRRSYMAFMTIGMSVATAVGITGAGWNLASTWLNI